LYQLGIYLADVKVVPPPGVVVVLVGVVGLEGLLQADKTNSRNNNFHIIWF
jgi:hypothetical protein